MTTAHDALITEADFQQQVIDLAHLAGWEHLHVRRTIGRGQKWTTSTNKKGWPDLLLWKPGDMIAAELKSQEGKPTSEQLEVLSSLAAVPIDSFVWRPSDWPAIQARLTRRTP
jgi:hypothetical protein